MRLKEEQVSVVVQEKLGTNTASGTQVCQGEEGDWFYSMDSRVGLGIRVEKLFRRGFLVASLILFSPCSHEAASGYFQAMKRYKGYHYGNASCG